METPPLTTTTSHFPATHNPHYSSSPSTIGYTYGASTPYGLPRRRKHSWAKNLPPHRQHPKSWPTPWQPKHPTSQINNHVCSPPPHQEQHKAFIAFSHTTSTLSTSSITTSAICMPSFQHNHSYILHIQATSRCLSQKKLPNYPPTNPCTPGILSNETYDKHAKIGANKPPQRITPTMFTSHATPIRHLKP
jgi:hypothetical protein